MTDEIAIHALYDKIYAELRKVHERSGDPGFFLSEMVLFNYLYHRKNKSLDDYTDFGQHVETLADFSIEVPRKFFYGGKAGIDWFLSYLHKEGVIDDEDQEFLRSGDSEQAAYSLYELRKGNYDLLHGAVGIAYYLLYERGIEYEEYFREFIQELNNMCDASPSGMIANFDMIKRKVMPNEVNLGLSHGIPSLLKFCIGCYEKGICSHEAEKLAKKIMKYIMYHARENHPSGRIAYMVTNNEAVENIGRLAWCYGDLGTAFILYQAGLVFDDKDLVAFSIDTLKGTTKWIDDAQTNVIDAGFCHGTSGAAYIYHKLWFLTQEADFKEARDRWLDQTLQITNDTSNGSGYINLNLREGGEDFSLLQGTIGVGLVLHSLLTDEFDWDYYLMLN